MREHNALRGLRVFGLVTAIAFAFPGVYLVWRNFTSGADPLGLLFSNQTLQPLWRTIYLAGLVSVSAACLGTALAWLTARTDLPFRKLWRALLPVPLVFPTFIGAAAFIRALSPGG
ncbi:MAG: iron ABC transporter permease, partial [Actinomycetota bacterium]|nr:iron ABC transporter permease [Actinomycetota bacterium]